MDIFTLADRTARSFALTLGMMPATVRMEILTAYLLARTSDSLADSGHVSVDSRLSVLQDFGAVVQGESDRQNLMQNMQTIAAAIPHAGEAELLREFPLLMATFDALEMDAQQRVRAVLSTILSGQELDVQRFGTGEPHRLATTAELHDYTWRVAGCVGEFWTDVLAAKLPASLVKSVVEMRALGRQYGQGLQLLNILRDAPVDFRVGRCYLPGPEFPASPSELFAEMRTLIPQCKEWLDAGNHYGKSLRGWRVRCASRLPAALGHSTLAALETATENQWLERVKIPRSRVRLIVFQEAVQAIFN